MLGMKAEPQLRERARVRRVFQRDRQPDLRLDHRFSSTGLQPRFGANTSRPFGPRAPGRSRPSP